LDLNSPEYNREIFDYFITDLFEREGYEISLTKFSGDRDVEIIASDSNEKIVIQTKRNSQNITNKVIQEVIAGANYMIAIGL
jgi:HJR/Mrr/RecB family endonuclease